MHIRLKKAAVLLTAVCMLSAAACGTTTPGADVPDETSAVSETAEPENPAKEAEPEPEPVPAPETEAPEPIPETEPAPETESEPEPETEAAPEPEPDPETEAAPESEPEPETEPVPEPEAEPEPEPEPAETKPHEETNIAGVPMTEVLRLRERDEKARLAKEEEERKAKEYAAALGSFNYLTGLPCTAEQQKKRPVAIMLNNLRLQLPQFGLDYGQIFYECVTEGSITRLMMLTTDYENMGTVGSIRSSRNIFAETVPDFDAIYVHAGGSPGAYSIILNRGLTNLDGANMYLPSTYFRDQWRLNNIGYEHSLMTNGAGIVSGIQFKGYRTELKDDYEPVFTFYNESNNHLTGGAKAEHVRIYSTPIQTVDFVYDAKTGQYLRYHYNGIAHKDGNTGTQVSVKNVIVLFMDIGVIPGDEASRVDVKNVGTGTGYYMTNGQYVEIAWSRSDANDRMHYTYPDGEPLVLNAGKTFVCIVDKSVKSTMSFNYKW